MIGSGPAGLTRPGGRIEGVDPVAVRRSIVRFSAVGLLLYLATMVVALFSAPACLIAHFLIALYYCFQQIRPDSRPAGSPRPSA